MKKKTWVLILGLILFLFSCSAGTDDPPGIYRGVIDGVDNVFNPRQPLKGKITLDLEKVVEIDSSETDSTGSVFFHQVCPDESGFLYFADHKNHKIHKFNRKGTWLSSFSVRRVGGAGFEQMGGLQILKNQIWIAGRWPTEIVRYNTGGSFVSEWRSEKYYNFYLQPIIVDDSRFLTVGFQQEEMAGSPERKRISALLDFNENVLQTYFTRRDVGPMILTVGTTPPQQVSITDSFIVPRILHAYDFRTEILYVLFNCEYRVEIKNLRGETLMVVHKEYEQIDIDKKDRDELVRHVAADMSPSVQEVVKERLPDHYCVLAGVFPLDQGHFAVQRVTGFDSIEIDIFDRRGRCLYSILPSDEVPGLTELCFFRGHVGWIEHREDRDVYREFRIKNVQDVF